jgi:hypothetical protein
MPLLPYLASGGVGETSSKGNAQYGIISPIAHCHALAIAALAAELLESLNVINEGGISAGGIDYLQGVRSGLENLIRRVVGPLITTVKNELEPILDLLAVAPALDPALGSSPNDVSALAAAIPSAVSRLARFTNVPGDISEPAHAALLIALVWRALVALSSRPLPDAFIAPFNRLGRSSSGDGLREATGAAVGSGSGKTPPGMKTKRDLPPLVVALQNIGARSSSSAPSSPIVSNAGETGIIAASSTNIPSPPATPRFGRTSLPLGSRPPPGTRFSRIPLPLGPPLTSSSSNGGSSKNSKSTSPTPVPLSPIQSLLADTIAVQRMLETLGKPRESSLALEAVHEAFIALDAFKEMLRVVVEDVSEMTVTNGKTGMGMSMMKQLADMTEKLVKTSEDVPVLIGLNVLLQLVPSFQLPHAQSSIPTPTATTTSQPGGPIIAALGGTNSISVPRLLGLPADRYYEGCLTTFGRAQASGDAIGFAVMEHLVNQPVNMSTNEQTKGLDVQILLAWLTENIDDDGEEEGALHEHREYDGRRR